MIHRKRQCHILLFFLILLGCASLGKVPTELIEDPRSSVGFDCLDKDGGNLIFLQAGDFRVPLTLDWMTQRDGTFTAEFSDPLGQPLGTWIVKKDMAQSSPFPQAGLDVSVNETGFVLVNGHNTHIKPFELGCLFKGKLPYAWLGNVQKDEYQWESQYRDGMRSISFHQEEAKICGCIGDVGWLNWLRRDLRICFENENGKISWGDSYFLEWRKLDGEDS